MKTLLRRPYLTLLWLAVVLVLTLTPAAEMPETPDWQLLSFDTAGHAGTFGLLALLAWPWVRTWSSRPNLLILTACVTLGALIEVLQYAMHAGRHAEWTDLLADTIGAALALACVHLGHLGYRRLAGAAVLLLLSLAAHAQAAPAAPDLPRARRTIEALAAPAMHGRGYVQGGEHLAAAYLRGQLKELGLQPLAPDYTQPFTLDVNTFPGEVKLTALTSRVEALDPFRAVMKYDSVVLTPGTDFIVAPESGGTPRQQWALALRFDTLLFNKPSYWRNFQQGIAGIQKIQDYRIRKGLMTAPPFLIVNAGDEKRLASLPAAWQRELAQFPNRIVLVPKLTASVAATSQPFIRLEALKFPDAYPISFKIQLDTRLEHDYQTQNLAAVVRGAAQPDSFVVVTAHYDHLGLMGKNVYFPGANDNASGVALLLALAAHYARPENQPTCSVAFLLFGAEEAGLLGSSYFVQHPLLPLPRIKFLVNLDLLGTGEEGATVVNGRVYEAAYQRLTALNEAHHYLPRLTTRGRAANSDHYPFSEAGVPAFFLYTRGGSPAYHDVNDQPAALSLAGFAGAYGLVRDFLNAQGAASANIKKPGR